MIPPIHTTMDTISRRLDRSSTNGFRCYKELPGDTTTASLTAPLSMAFAIIKKKPVDDATFAIFLRQFNYDKTPLNAKIDSTIEYETWMAEKISFDAAYNHERMEAWIFLQTAAISAHRFTGSE